LGIETIHRYGFTVALSDIDLSNETIEQLTGILDQAEKEVDELIKKFHDNTLEVMPGRSIEETLELRILERLNRARDDVGKIVQEKAKQDSNTLQMIMSGSRGNLINLAQMAACVGQQALRGQRIKKGYFRRTLSCFKKDDLRATPRGFIRHGFKFGLRPAESFFMAMTGRDSLMDTALRTPKSGYLYRRLANALQDLKVEYDYTVRDASGKIVQFMYGEDGLDVSKSEAGKINVRKIIRQME
jgi:DNA-directed RNA polymerase subunit A'